MINKIQMKLLPLGEHTNSSIRERYKVPNREVNFVDEEGKKSSYTPNRRQRKELVKANAKSMRSRIFQMSPNGKAQAAAKLEKASAKLKNAA